MAGLGIGIAGCAGRMGRMLIAEAQATAGCRVVGGIDAKGSPALGTDLGTLANIGAIGVKAGDDPEALFAASDVVIDFSTPEAAVVSARLAAQHKKPLLLGTTGLNKEQGDAVRTAAKSVAIVWPPNTSLGVTLLLAMVEDAAKRLGPEWDIEIVEMHHKHKVDAPSGTALALGHAAAAGRHIDLGKNSARGRDGITGTRAAGHIGFAALRGGDVAGDHTVIFAGAGERLELTHRAASRQIFAKGAIKAALWLGQTGRKPGLYGMKDVLGL
ncbi:MAG TPA: 4-hydroxy-tetrahydrodipicolinate reductase [Stellaceae bacterium]|nr:4-hydroxy-tetrahydrodipicolinate reductase [Stellaceae bacterium]